MAENSCLPSPRINIEYHEDWSSTQIKVIRHRHTWSINNFSFCSEGDGGELQSPTFSIGTNSSPLEWRLRLYPNGVDNACSNIISLYLSLIKCKMSVVSTIYKLGIVNANGQDVNVYEYLVGFKEGYDSGEDTFLLKHVLFNQENKLLSDDKLTIFCEITATVGSENISGTLTVPESDLEKDFEVLFENKHLSDVTLCVGGKEFPTHKIILTARSPVFWAFFHQDMKETKTNRVELSETDQEGVNEMLRYMYTGKINKLKEMAPRLLGMAEKYAMDGLKSMCEKALFESLSFENAAEFLILSDTFGANQLREQIKEFIVAHASDVGNTPGFQEMAQRHPHLALEVFRVLSNSID